MAAARVQARGTDLSASKAGLCPDPPKGRALWKPFT